jgi:hypothetical protein
LSLDGELMQPWLIDGKATGWVRGEKGLIVVLVRLLCRYDDVLGSLFVLQVWVLEMRWERVWFVEW